MGVTIIGFAEHFGAESFCWLWNANPSTIKVEEDVEEQEITTTTIQPEEESEPVTESNSIFDNIMNVIDHFNLNMLMGHVDQQDDNNEFLNFPVVKETIENKPVEVTTERVKTEEVPESDRSLQIDQIKFLESVLPLAEGE